MSEELLDTADFHALHREIEQRYLEAEAARDKALADVERLTETLKYARRFLNPKDHDMAYVDAALKETEPKP